MKKNYLLLALTVLTSSSLFAVTHGSIIKKKAPLDVVVDAQWGQGGNVFSANAEVDFKAVTINGKLWAKIVGTDYLLGADPWSSQTRIYTPNLHEISKNNDPKYVEVDQATNTTIVTAYPYTDISQISVCQGNIYQYFNGTAIWDYNVDAVNSGLTGDDQKPVLTKVEMGTQDGTSLPISCRASDNSGDYFYLVTDVANDYYFASFADDFTVTGLDPAKTYNLSVVAVDFSGNESDGLIKEDLIFTTTGSCASYIKWNNPTSTEVGTYEIEKTELPIVVDAVAEGAWSRANAEPIANIAHETKSGGVLNLSAYPQTEAYAYAVYKALWTNDGVYMFISVKDEYPRYQDTGWQWENDGIEFYFSKDRGEGKTQIIIPAMVGTTKPPYPEPLLFESGSAVGSNKDYKVFGYDTENWDESLFNWAIKRTSDGWDMEVYMDKDIVTNGNSSTNYGLGKIFAGDINLDIAGLTLNNGSYGRECGLAMLGNSNQEYAGSNDYGYFKMVNGPSAVNTPKDANFKVIYNADSKVINVKTDCSVGSTSIYNVAGQLMSTTDDNSIISVNHLKPGLYIVKANDLKGNVIGIQKIIIY